MKNFIVNSKYLLIVSMLFFSAAVLGAELEVVTENWRPYHYMEDGEIKGISTKIVKQLLDKSGIKYKINVYPWARAYQMAQTKQNVLIYTIIKTPQREKLFKWVGPLREGGNISLYRLKKNKHITATTIEQAKRYTIATNNNSMDHIWLKNKGFSKLISPSRVEQALRMFFKGRTEMIALNDSIILEQFNRYGFDQNDVVSVIPLFRALPYMALSNSTSEDIVEKLQIAYDDLFRENKLFN